ncbi:hypothetical protein CYMTET_56951 [Cymbomonas tetramitiformis]|uniref:Uncharacterized protein n=1 Tax=Cymbomonas tetramitiformis TaxID=36881 RepID=A0AAE0BB37_9CHLO|nr:hypothetical protein CYMTET_56951 [Cymbomonas tetramitiformis]
MQGVLWGGEWVEVSQIDLPKPDSLAPEPAPEPLFLEEAPPDGRPYSGCPRPASANAAVYLGKAFRSNNSIPSLEDAEEASERIALDGLITARRCEMHDATVEEVKMRQAAKLGDLGQSSDGKPKLSIVRARSRTVGGTRSETEAEESDARTAEEIAKSRWRRATNAVPGIIITTATKRRLTAKRMTKVRHTLTVANELAKSAAQTSRDDPSLQDAEHDAESPTPAEAGDRESKLQQTHAGDADEGLESRAIQRRSSITSILIGSKAKEKFKRAGERLRIKERGVHPGALTPWENPSVMNCAPPVAPGVTAGSPAATGNEKGAAAVMAQQSPGSAGVSPSAVRQKVGDHLPVKSRSGRRGVHVVRTYDSEDAETGPNWSIHTFSRVCALKEDAPVVRKRRTGFVVPARSKGPDPEKKGAPEKKEEEEEEASDAKPAENRRFHSMTTSSRARELPRPSAVIRTRALTVTSGVGFSEAGLGAESPEAPRRSTLRTSTASRRKSRFNMDDDEILPWAVAKNDARAFTRASLKNYIFSVMGQRAVADRLKRENLTLFSTTQVTAWKMKLKKESGVQDDNFTRSAVPKMFEEALKNKAFRQAAAIVAVDAERYGKVIKAYEEDMAVMRMLPVARAYPQGPFTCNVAHYHKLELQEKPVQNTNNLFDILKVAKRTLEQFVQLFEGVAKRTGAFQFAEGKHFQEKYGPSLKKLDRIVEKGYRSYKMDWAQLTDVVRCSLVYHSLDALLGGVLFLIRDIQPAYGWKILRIKNRLHPDFDAKNSGGYRDLSMNVMGATKHVCEVQFHWLPVFNIKVGAGDGEHGEDNGHRRYIRYRNLRLE